MQEKINGEWKDTSFTKLIPDESGWFNASKYRPISFDLVQLKVVSHVDRKTMLKTGWSSPPLWEGYRLDPKDKVISWRKINGNLHSW